MEFGTMIFFVLTGAVLGLSVWNRSRNPLGVNASVLLASMCLLTNACVLIWDTLFSDNLAMYPYFATPFPIFDALGLLYCAMLLEKQRSWWLGLLSISFLAAQAIHYSYWKVDPPHLPYNELASTVQTYVDRLNMLYSVQLTLLAVVGGISLVSVFGRAVLNLLGGSGPVADKASFQRKATKEP